MRILITGSSGFIGGYLTIFLERLGHQVFKASPVEYTPEGEEFYDLSLGESLGPFFDKQEIDVLVHLAHSAKDEDEELNYLSTTQWANEAERHGVKTQIFLSSLTAKKNSESGYGRVKFKLEKWFLQKTYATVLRPGLVVGNGGLFGRMVGTVSKIPIMPIIGATKPVYLTSISDLCHVISESLSGQYNGKVYGIQYDKPIMFGEIFKAIAKAKKMKRLFVRVPTMLVYYLVLLMSKVPFVKLNVTPDNIRGLNENAVESYQCDLGVFNINKVPNLFETIVNEIK